MADRCRNGISNQDLEDKKMCITRENKDGILGKGNTHHHFQMPGRIFLTATLLKLDVRKIKLIQSEGNQECHRLV